MIDLGTQRHALYALFAAALFGISAPIAKLLGADMGPVALAALLYLGSGLALATWMVVGRLGGGPARRSLRIDRSALPWLLGSIVSGGVLGPLALLWGLQSVSGSAASLLLSFEAIFTALIAATFFRESIDRRVWAAALLMLVASALLTLPQASSVALLGAGSILLACLFWGIDNNLTRNISAADPVLLAMIKGLGAGSFNAALAWALGQMPGEPTAIGMALLVGAGSYGISLVLFIVALRHLGSARTAAHFGCAPFFGAAFAVLVIKEPGSAWLMAAMALMAIATWLVLTEHHEHLHVHEPMEHEHEHRHDVHHSHHHDEIWPSNRPHSHRHRHDALSHAHRHLPDLHHRHSHEPPPAERS